MIPLLLACALGAAQPSDKAEKLAETYVSAIAKLNEEHARKPGREREDDLARRLPDKARKALEELLGLEDSDEVRGGIARAAEAALDLALVEDYDRLRERLRGFAPEQAEELGVALARPRFLLRGLGGLEVPYLEHFAEVLDGILGAYDELFGFEEFSKVPGKKLRVRVHLEPRITRPPHFAPEFPWHSEVDFPVIDAERLRSPTADGKFLFYGLCHELGHVIAMWGNPGNEEDHHAWAHYTGCAVVEHLSQAQQPPQWLGELRDVRWRSLAKERERVAGKEPSTKDEEGVMALLLALHEELGPRALGDAINWLDREDRRPRVNRVRYYSFRDLQRGLEETLENPAKKKRARALLEGKRP